MDTKKVKPREEHRSENAAADRRVYDFGRAIGDGGLKMALESISRNGYELVCVTHVDAGHYLLVYRRPMV